MRNIATTGWESQHDEVDWLTYSYSAAQSRPPPPLLLPLDDLSFQAIMFLVTQPDFLLPRLTWLQFKGDANKLMHITARTPLCFHVSNFCFGTKKAPLPFAHWPRAIQKSLSFAIDPIFCGHCTAHIFSVICRVELLNSLCNIILILGSLTGTNQRNEVGMSQTVILIW